MPNNNPYFNATTVYGNMEASTDQRSLEGKVLLRSATKLEAMARRLQDGEKPTRDEIGEVLEYNQKLWTIFATEMADESNGLPQQIKNNIASLGLFVFKRTKDILIDTTPEKFGALIEINRNIAAGLMKSAATPAAKDPAAQAKPIPTDSTI